MPIQKLIISNTKNACLQALDHDAITLHKLPDTNVPTLKIPAKLDTNCEYDSA